MEERATAHFETLRQDVRDEMKRRIEQRDKYSIQLTIALGALVAVSLSTGFGKALVAAPLISVYFTVLILYSYQIHYVLAKYLREEIEPGLAYLYGTPLEKEWETYYYYDYKKNKKREVPGIRRSFFLVALWVIWFLTLLYLWVTDGKQGEFPCLVQFTDFRKILVSIAIVYFIANLWITIRFRGTKEASNKPEQSKNERLATKV